MNRYSNITKLPTPIEEIPFLMDDEMALWENSKWIVKKKISEKPDAETVLKFVEDDSEIYLRDDWGFIRKTRDSILRYTDWTMIDDAPLTSEEKEKWKIFRQKLRDLPQKFEGKDEPLIWPDPPDTKVYGPTLKEYHRNMFL
jgi:hypothetical protein